MAFIVVATGNMHKVEEYKQLLADQDIELKSLKDYPNCPEVVEDGKTFTENASKKAVEVCRYCDVPTFADDSGLEVEALGGEPGIYSSRYAENDKARIEKVLTKLEGQDNRRARFVCVIASAINVSVQSSKMYSLIVSHAPLINRQLSVCFAKRYLFLSQPLFMLQLDTL